MSRDATEGASQGDFVLRLFVTGHTEKSVRAVRNLTRLCEKHLQGRYDLEVVDLYQQPELATEHQLVAAPTLIKMLPLPLNRLIGDMSDARRVLTGLGIAG
jgi:circadian clock protein KaiB